MVREIEFERAENFKYLRMELNVSSNNHKEIPNRINSANKCFSALKTILKSILVSIGSNVNFI